MKTFFIIFFLYFVGAVATKEMLYVMYSKNGIWGNRIEKISKTNFLILCPVVNFIFPIVWFIKGIHWD